MKKTIFILTVIFSFFAFAKAESQQAPMDEFTIQVDGLGCPFCAYGLEKKFKEFKGIKKVRIDIETGDFSFKLPASRKLTMEELVAQVDAAGYTPNEAIITRANGTVETNAVEKEVFAAVDLTESTLYVYGKCGMCKARIEKAVNNLSGVATASWDQKTSMLTVKHKSNITSKDQVASAAAAVGHDTKKVKSNDAAYEELPACCHYKRAI